MRPAVTKAAATLYDIPVSNHGARVRVAIYAKGLADEVTIASPADLGGIKSPEYLALHPQGKMPLLVLDDGQAIPESEIIVQFLLDKYASTGPSLLPSTPELRARSAGVCRHHDLYVAPVQGAMYRAMDTQTRAGQLAELHKQLQILDAMCSTEGPFFLPGNAATHADGAIVPTMCFVLYALPKYFKWKGEHNKSLDAYPNLSKWFSACTAADASLKKVADEVTAALAAWDEGGRWEKVGVIDDVKNTEYQWTF